MAIDGAKIRSTLLQVAAERSRQTPDASLHPQTILNDTARKLSGERRTTQDEDQALLVAFYDLFRTGHFSWGWNLNNPSPPHFHITVQGRRTLEHLSRDPSNPDGYVAYLASRASLNPIARSYVGDALRTYNADCFRAAAVMIGAAAESIVLDLRDAIVTGVQRTGGKPAKDLSHITIKKILDAIYKELEMQQAGMSVDLREQFIAYWPALVQQIRAARNEAGHPVNIQPITTETVHAALLIFPELAALGAKLLLWAPTYYVSQSP